ncbi:MULTISPECIES: hypothetical protein [unclassified Saccharibacter]|uniref:hypothetical protein n=1 Tax=unclassified Saccharibacter TaxID=2648722 RepID=UPI001325570A|nr:MULTISPECIES: hypothetical protein [unclassified Saccharibacter]MXV35679.1 hypothetical protein [Saccharibacter sp. EH611]MXV58293.1 hypothetical protein [Saccharibacter sp. EH70]MXV66410.1 hypothetical protein [Saccharibacter sp. EH60]
MAVKSGFGMDVSGLEKLKKQLQQLREQFPKEATLTVGWDQNCRYPDGKYVAPIALLQEYGGIVPAPPDMKGKSTVLIPARPFLRPCMAQHEAKWDYILAQGVKEAITDKSLTGEKILLRVGLTMKADLKASINAVNSPELSTYTIRKRLEKRSYSADALKMGMPAKPLQDSGYMLSSIAYFLRPGIPGKDG